MQQHQDSSYRPPWRSLLFTLLLTIGGELFALRWGQQAKLVLNGAIFFCVALYAVYVGIFCMTELPSRLIVFSFAAAMFGFLSAFVVETLQQKAIAISCGVGLFLFAAELMSRYYPDSVIDDLLRRRSK